MTLHNALVQIYTISIFARLAMIKI